MIKKIKIDQLTPGMFVHQILEQDGALTVKSQGRVTSADVVKTLKKRGVKTLAIDTDKNFDAGESAQEAVPEATQSAQIKNNAKPKKVTLTNELNRASKLHVQGKAIQKLLLANLQKETPFDASIPKAFSNKLVESVDRNPDALLCLTKIREKDDYLLEHSLNVAILLANFGTFLGMSEEDVQDLSYAGFLHDLGKIKIPDEILHKPGRLTDSEMEIMKGHVKHGVDYLKSTDIAAPLIKTISEHHERLDGLGYPAGTKGNAISKAGRMLAIADMYDALTADRVYKSGMSSQKAFSILMNDAPTRLDQTLVQQFIKCLGVYPVGSLVLLSNDRLGMVLEQRDSPLTPLVKEFFSVRNNHYLPPRDIDLALDKTVSIAKAVIASDYKIDVNSFFERSVAT
ncbi:metal-dependent phosphohydrolase [Alteromonas mediterranea]|uniref:Metal-dependent phosphohydrolase n=1 Tax=Alteromonas mediterranea TaxID=314275 RepID=A0AAC9JH32_9ALTE|nr:HD-GYP domain-containing protein [Alteromonas mediterranea]APD91588.1 metal-dependent phosphohydrolase [Alteromonas mediterranea]APE03682.1 metal-dependent phosphohydrolase [Alteromonas mediterranea]